MTFCEQVAGWAVALSADGLPASVLERARIQSAATLAAAEAGEEAAAPAAATAPDGPLGEIWRGAAASIAHDWDDYLYMGHTGHSAVWAARAFASDPDSGAALFLGPHNGQFWSSIHCAGAAVAAGLASGLDAERLAHAIAIALYQPPFGLWPGFMGPPTKLLTAAEPAVQGARAVLLAAEGLTGPLDVVEHPRGLLRHFSYVPRPAMLGALGTVWLTDTLAFKPNPGCAYLQAAVDAALQVEARGDEIESVEIDAGYLTIAMDALNGAPPLSAVGVNFSTPLSVAVAMIARRLTHLELTPAWLNEHEHAIQALARRVRVRHDWELTLRTVRGTVDGGGSLRDVPPAALPRLLRHLREEAGGGGLDLRQLLRRRELRAELGRLARTARAPGPKGIAAIDPPRMRMTFPARLRVRLRSGRSIDVEGDEPGSCGRPIEEQRAVVDRKTACITGQFASVQ